MLSKENRKALAIARTQAKRAKQVERCYREYCPLQNRGTTPAVLAKTLEMRKESPANGNSN